MKTPGNSLDKLLLLREMNGTLGGSSTRNIYGSRSFIENLDIVNELHGHSGCVNALCWSDSGNLLASGSDDTNVNIHTRSSSTSTFSFTHSISTGHTQNIFSVKFMPHSDDRTIVCCAGDTEVRVFDIEHSASANINNSWAASTRNTSRLSYGEVNTRVYRSHTDRVKRIVTESSPNLFLTCSEDGDIRQFDTREPSHQTSRNRVHPRYSENADETRKPLISYRKAKLDLNTVSVSTSQPHYLALGGSHLFCFLHDRRMLREKDNAPICVRKFIPKKGESWSDNLPRHGHITACKISNACPNELVASWSAGGIGFFDIHRSPDAEEQAGIDAESEKSTLASSSKRVKTNGARAIRNGKSRETSSLVEGTPSTSSERKRKRGDPRRSPSAASADAAWRERSSSQQTQDFDRSEDPAHVGSLSETERMAVRIANSFVEIRKGIFGLSPPSSRDPDAEEKEASDQMTLSITLERAEKCLGFMDTYISKHDSNSSTEPESSAKASTQNTSTPLPTLKASLKKRRRRARKFVQACGTLIKALNRIHLGSASSHNYEMFSCVASDGNEEEWGYQFLRVVIGYLNHGPSGVKAIVSVDEDQPIDSFLENLLLSASRSEETGIPDLEASPMIFECDFNAVRAFMGVMTLTPSDTDNIGSVPRRFWGLKVARGLLMRLGTGIDYSFMESAFGGLSAEDQSDKPKKENTLKRGEVSRTFRETMRDAILEDNLDALEGALSAETRMEEPRSLVIDDDASPGRTEDASGDDDLDMENDADFTEVTRLLAGIEDAEHMEIEESDDEEEEDFESGDDIDVFDDGNEEESSSDDDEDDDDDNDAGEGDDASAHILRRITRGGQHRAQAPGASEKLHKNVPAYENTRMYRGHCNVQTVKDVNFYGLDDEYVVSGSDCGHVFIWDKRTTELVQLLLGDSSVVNVVQGHPSEPLIAVSGIDNTVKIFSPDKQLQHQARQGVGLNNSKKLPSRQKMNEKDDIVGENEVGRQSGLRDAVITARIQRTIWSQLAARLQERQEAGEEISIQESCQVN